jgi:hypothetical protein
MTLSWLQEKKIEEAEEGGTEGTEKAVQLRAAEAVLEEERLVVEEELSMKK